MKSYSEAYRIIKNEINLLKSEDEEVSLLDSTGRILTEDIYSQIELPSFNNSAMDGICIKFTENTKSWNITDEISAGNFHNVQIESDEAILIMTGGRIPDCCDTVIPVEDINIDENRAELKLNSIIKPGQNIRKTGQDLKNGEHIAANGRTIKPVNVSLLAACGIEKVKVRNKLKFGIMATGDELVDISETPVNDKIRASNLYALVSLVKSLNMDYTNYGIIKDNKTAIKEKIKTAINDNVDIILTSGGVSVGKFDYMQEVLKDIGFEIIFWRVNIKPGKPLLFARIKHDKKNILLFGLPGNPVSAIINFLIFIKKAIQETIYNITSIKNEAVLLNDVKKSDNKKHFVRGNITFNSNKGILEISTDKNQSSSNMTGLSFANALAVIGENQKDPKAGDKVECIMI